MNLLQLILLPFSWLYRLITDIRNWMYKKGYKNSIRFHFPVISVGNLTVGGTGKTPHVEYLVRLLKDSYKLATLSRGYGRKTKGFLLAHQHATATDIGDEPMQFYQKFSNQVLVAVGEKRAQAICEIRTLHPDIQLIILDDAFQHRAVQPSLSILLSDYNKPFYADYVLPSGRLRERRSGAQRADILIVTKCPEVISGPERAAIIANIHTYARKESPVFFTCIRYSQPVNFANTNRPLNAHERILLISGLANSKPLEAYVKENYQLCHHLRFKDHHSYTAKDIELIVRQAQIYKASCLLVTEKDYVKLRHPAFSSLINDLRVYYLPIEVCFLFGETQAFHEKVLKSISEPAK